MVASEFQGETEVGAGEAERRARRKDGKQHRSCGSMLAIASLQAQRHTAGGLGGLVGVAQLLGLWSPDNCMSNCVFLKQSMGWRKERGSLPDLILPILLFCCCTIIHHELNDFTNH